jgi:hypothetical protein
MYKHCCEQKHPKLPDKDDENTPTLVHKLWSAD